MRVFSAGATHGPLADNGHSQGRDVNNFAYQVPAPPSPPYSPPFSPMPSPPAEPEVALPDTNTTTGAVLIPNDVKVDSKLSTDSDDEYSYETEETDQEDDEDDEYAFLATRPIGTVHAV